MSYKFLPSHPVCKTINLKDPKTRARSEPWASIMLEYSQMLINQRQYFKDMQELEQLVIKIKNGKDTKFDICRIHTLCRKHSMSPKHYLESK